VGGGVWGGGDLRKTPGGGIYSTPPPSSQVLHQQRSSPIQRSACESQPPFLLLEGSHALNHTTIKWGLDVACGRVLGGAHHRLSNGSCHVKF